MCCQVSDWSMSGGRRPGGEMKTVVDGPADASRTFLFAHGAGGAMDTPFMSDVASRIASHGIRVVRFEFPYMAARREGGKRGAPDRPAVLIASWHEAITSARGAGRLFIGGKSMGGRIATMVADEAGVDGAICFGYPFHPPGKPHQLRTAHLETLTTPTLILQGERDPFGTRAEVEGYRLSLSVAIEWLDDGDHSLRPRRASGNSTEKNLARAVDAAVTFMGAD